MIWLLTAGVVLMAIHVFLLLVVIGRLDQFCNVVEKVMASQMLEQSPTDRIFGKLEEK